MDGAREIPLKKKLRDAKPKGKNRADYMGNTGASRASKHVKTPAIHGIKRKRHIRTIFKKR